MGKRGIIALNPLWIGWLDAGRSIIVICILGAMGAALICSSIGSGIGLKGIADPSGYSSSIADSSYDSSSIQLRLTSESNSSNSPARINAGSGYYSSFPITCSSSISSRTQVLSKSSQAASLYHSIQSAQEISGSSEYTVSERSYREGDSTKISSTSLGMRIDETVTEGKVNIGAFQADLTSQDDMGEATWGKMSNLRKKPALEMEEEYIGNFHISRNMTIISNYIDRRGECSWLGCDSPYLSFIPSEPISISADEVFKCLNCEGNR